MDGKSRIGSLSVVFVLLAALLAGCGAGQSDPTDRTLQTVTVERGSLVTNITAVGSVLSQAQVTLSFEGAGRVATVLITEGALVPQGQPLVQLDTAELELQVKSAQAGLEAADAQLEQLLAGPSPQEIAVSQGQVASAQAALDQAIAQRDQLITGTNDSEVIVAQAQLSSAQTLVKQLQRQLDQVRAQDPAPEVDIAEVEVERSKIALDEAQDEYNKALDRPWEDQSIRDSLAKQLQQAQLNYRLAQAQLERSLNSQTAYIINLDVISIQIEDAQTSVKAAQARVLQAQNSLEPRQRAAEAAVGAAMAQRNIAQAQFDLLSAGTTDADTAVARASVDQAQVALESAELALQRAALNAPFDGIIARIGVAPGELVTPQAPVLTLVSDRQFSIEADVDEADVGWIEIGQEAQVTLDSFPGRSLAGQVVAVLPSATLDLGIVSYRVTIGIDRGDLSLRDGMTANIEIVRERRQDTLVLPNQAIWIDSKTGRPFVEQVIDEQIAVTFIEQGLTNDEYSEVLTGLQEGDTIAIRLVSARDRFREVITGAMTGN